MGPSITATGSSVAWEGVRVTSAGRARTLLDQHRAIGFAVAVTVLVVDQASKAWAVAALTGKAAVPVLGRFLTLRLIYNGGSAFSFGDRSTWIFTVIAAAAVVALTRWVWTAHTRLGALTLGLLLGGAVTHLLDRLLRAPGFGVGKVVDFIDYDEWFIGNVADIALVTGSAALGLLLFTGRETLGGRTGSAESR
jgi:signal peptidase II